MTLNVFVSNKSKTVTVDEAEHWIELLFGLTLDYNANDCDKSKILELAKRN